MNDKIATVKEAVIRHRRKIAVVAGVVIATGLAYAAITQKSEPVEDNAVDQELTDWSESNPDASI